MRNIYIDDQGRIYEGKIVDIFKDADGIISEINKINQELNRDKTKGGNIMNKLFNKSDKGKVIEIDKRDGTIKRKAKVIKDITVMSVKGTLKDPWTYAAGGSIGLQQGLKYKGDFKSGGKAGLATVAVLAGVNVAGNIIGNMEVIKEA